MEDKTVAQPAIAGRRAAAYWFIDGLPEILFGIGFLILGGTGLVWGFDTRNPWMKAATLVVALTVLVLYLKDRAILDCLKARLTYRRTGYVRPPAEPESKRDIITPLFRRALPYDYNVTSFRKGPLLPFLYSVWLMDAWRDVPARDGHWIVPLVMATVALGVYLLNLAEDAHRYSWQSVLAIALAGLLCAGLEVPPGSRRFIPLLIGGAWLLAHGIPTLVRYLRTYPAPKGEGA